MGFDASVKGLAVSKLELGKTEDPKASTVAAIADRLGVTLGWLAHGDLPKLKPAPESTLDRSTADPDPPTDQDEDIRQVAAEVGIGEDGERRLRAIRRSAGRMPRSLLFANAETIKADQATGMLAHPKVVDRSESTTRGDAGLMKTSVLGSGKGKRKA